jgi:hypothetical protein
MRSPREAAILPRGPSLMIAPALEIRFSGIIAREFADLAAA